MIGESNMPRWRYLFDCRACRNVQRVDDDGRKRHGRYCIPHIEAYDSGREDPFLFDDEARTIRCPHYRPQGEQMSLFDAMEGSR